MNWPTLLTLLIATAAALLLGWRQLDRRSDNNTWQRLAMIAEPSDERFEAGMVKALPEPAQRFFRYAIQPGSRLHYAVELEMTGELGLGTKESPNVRPMVAKQLLAPPHGLVWKLKAGWISGSDGATPDTSWTRFWLFGVIPIVRAGDNTDHHRSAFGRVVAEGAFWAPATLLPKEHVRWEPLNANSSRAIVQCARFEQAIDITVAPDGRPTRVVIQRWSNENPDKIFREQPFGGYLSGFEEFDGYRLPTVVEGGNHIGTDDYFPFYKATVTAIRFASDRGAQ